VLTLDARYHSWITKIFRAHLPASAKALATWTWDGQTKRVVHPTVAGAGWCGDQTGIADTYVNLLAALQQSGDPFVSLRVKSYRPAVFPVRGQGKSESRLPNRCGARRCRKSIARSIFIRCPCVRAAGSFERSDRRAVQVVPGVVAVDVNNCIAQALSQRLAERACWRRCPETLANGSLVSAELLDA